MKLLSWHELEEHPALRAGNVLDIRGRVSFEQGHLSGAVSLPVSLDAESSRALSDALPAVLLPPRHEPLLVYSDVAAQAARVVAFLQRRGRERVYGAVLNGDDVPSRRWVTGGGKGALWRPPSYLVQHFALLPPSNAGPVVDFGCGGGRAAVWLAERNYDVTAVDHLDDALAVAGRLARQYGVELKLLHRDLSKPAQVPAGPWSVAMCFRYLQRDLLRRLPELLRLRGVALVRTFRWVDGDARLPRRRYCLADGELRDLFPEKRWEILHHVEDHGDDGRPVAGIVARLR
ncbi:methyltransferase domain-containing protein [bacterium]|nr:methyltransferase domain-containing protein [bacterium]